MKRFQSVMGVMIALLGVAGLSASAQTAWPHITRVAPNYGQRGATVEITVSGVNVGQGTGLVFEGSGLTVESVTPEKTPPARNAEGKLVARVRIASDALPGRRALRALTPFGPSDVGYFFIGQWPEIAEKEPNNTPDKAQEITLPVTINGATDPGEDVDYFRFTAHKGQILVFDCLAARMDSPLDPALTLLDATGHELPLDEEFVGQDSVRIRTISTDGTYLLRLNDLRFQGGGNFAYRLTIGEIPFVTAAFPPGGAPGSSPELELTGFNLGNAHSQQVKLPTPMTPEVIPMPLTLPNGITDPVLLATGATPEILESEPNDDVARAQRVPVPITINGRLYTMRAGDKPDVDCFRFSATQGQKLVLEVFAQRLGSQLDSVLTIKDLSGKDLASNDDAVGRDSRLEFTAPQTGDYVAQVTDLHQRQGPNYPYRLEISAPLPDYRLAFVPERLAVGRGGRVPLVITATRLNGFDGEIALDITGLPPGVTLSGPARFAKGQTELTLVATAAPDAPLQGATTPSIIGEAMPGNKKLRRLAEGQMEEFVRRDDKIQRTTRPMPLPTASAAEAPDIVLTVAPEKLTLAPGKTLDLTVKITRQSGFKAKVPLSILGLPAGVTATAPDIPENQTEAKITLKAEGNATLGNTTLVVVGRTHLDELRSLPHASPPLPLTVAK